MAKYINAQQLKSYVNSKGSWLSDWDTLGVLAAIDKQPAADVRPERRGYWIPIFENAADEKRDVAMKYKCSECGNTAKDETYSHAMDYEFCPRCGAKMDGGAE